MPSPRRRSALGGIAASLAALLLSAAPSLAGLKPTPAGTFESNVANQFAGRSVAPAGDVNGDGYDDVVAIGNDEFGVLSNSKLYLFLGGPSGFALAPGFPAALPNGATVVCGAGDLDGDGFSDVAVGFPTSSSGVIRVYYAKGGTLDMAHPFIHTEPFSPYYGSVLAPAGDVNADGTDDLAVGDPGEGDEQQACSFNPNSAAGRVDVFYGTAGTGLDDTKIWELWGCTCSGTGSQLGYSVASAGDVNGDGIDDLIIGAPYTKLPTTLTYDGRVYVVFGKAGGLPTFNAGLGVILGIPTGTQIDSPVPLAAFGASVCTAGDVNIDGYADVAIGAPQDNSFAANGGAVRVYPGSAGGVDTNLAHLLWFEEGPVAGASFGRALAPGGDINGDGRPELLVGDRNQVDVAVSSGGTLFIATSLPVTTGAHMSFATAGDFNGDGLSDVVIGDPRISDPETDEGRIQLFLGSGDGPVTSPTSSFTTQLFNPNLGWSVASAGDVNSDGLDDVLVGAPTAGNIANPSETNNGLVFLTYGKSNGFVLQNFDWSYLGAPGDQVGVAVASANDINGDGYADIVVGAYQSTTGGNGKALVWYGHSGGIAPGSAPDVVLNGTTPGSQFGAAVAAGDFNGDGYADVAVGAPMDNVKDMTAAGRVFVYRGGPTGLGTTPLILSGRTAGEHFGTALVADADVNGDGYTDLVVGSPDFNNGTATGAGKLTEYHGSPFTTVVLYQLILGSKSGQGLGHALGHAGDVNGDGFADIVAGMPGANSGAGQACVYAGQGVPLGLNVTPLWTQDGFVASSGFGSSVSSAGDVDGDGLSDVLVGSVFETNGGPANRGAARVFAGPLVTGAPPVWTVFGPVADANLGHCVANAGDINGDGWSDLLCSQPGYTNTITRQGRVSLYEGAQGVSRFHLSEAFVPSSHKIQPLSLASGSSVGLLGFDQTAAGRPHARLQWKLEGVPSLAEPSLSGMQSTFTLGGTAGSPPGPYSLLGQVVNGVETGAPYSWRVRTLDHSMYFPTTPWLESARFGPREYTIRAPGSWVGVAPEPPHALTLELGRPSPNPTPRRSSVSFTLPHAGPVSLRIYDVQGHEVRRLLDGTRAAGAHPIAWDGRDGGGRAAPPGVYFYRLDALGASLSRKVVLVD